MGCRQWWATRDKEERAVLLACRCQCFFILSLLQTRSFLTRVSLCETIGLFFMLFLVLFCGFLW